MPTPKQTRFHYKRCRRRFYLLLQALTEAHQADVIDYKDKIPEGGKYPQPTLPSVCDAVHMAKQNFEIATKDQLYKALQTELLAELKGVW